MFRGLILTVAGITLAIQVLVGAPAKIITVEMTGFDLGRANPRQLAGWGQKKALIDSLEQVGQREGYVFVAMYYGHTDSVGNASANQRVGMARAQGVMNLFGIPGQMIHVPNSTRKAVAVYALYTANPSVVGLSATPHPRGKKSMASYALVMPDSMQYRHEGVSAPRYLPENWSLTTGYQATWVKDEPAVEYSARLRHYNDEVFSAEYDAGIGRMEAFYHPTPNIWGLGFGAGVVSGELTAGTTVDIGQLNLTTQWRDGLEYASLAYFHESLLRGFGVKVGYYRGRPNLELAVQYAQRVGSSNFWVTAEINLADRFEPVKPIYGGGEKLFFSKTVKIGFYGTIN